MGTIFIYGEFRETGQRWSLEKKKRLHYGNKICGLFPGMCFKNIIVIMYVFLFSCDFGKQHGFKNGF